MKPIASCALAVLLLTATGALCYGQDQPPSDQYVTRKEYDALKTELDAMKAQLQPLLQQKAAAPATSTQALEDVEEDLKAVKRQVEENKLGATKFLLAGYGAAGFTTHQHGGKNFSAAFNPIFLWKLNDRLFFHGEPELQLEGSATTVNLEQAYLAYFVNDYVTLSAGRFLNPSNFFVERLHPDWINKLPDKPLAVYDGLLPESLIGSQVRGGISIGPTKVGYALFASNAPSVRTADDATAAFTERVGTLDFANFDNTGGHLAVGGRVGFLPLPQLEIGYGFQTFNARANETSQGKKGTAGTLLQSVDLNYVQNADRLQGVVDLKAQWVWSHVGQTTYDPDSVQGFGPRTFNNNRNGGYVQLAYRPTKADWLLCRNFEPVLRFDVLNQSREAPGGFDERRWTLGLNDWLTPNNVVKLAYEFDNRKGQRDDNAFLLQWAVGF